MNNSQLFKVGSIDYSAHIQAGTYDVNAIDQTKEVALTSGHKRVKLLGRLVSGSFTLYFNTMDGYQSFLTNLESHKASNGALMMTVQPNNTMEPQEILALVEFKPVRTRRSDGVGTEYMRPFVFKVKEV